MLLRYRRGLRGIAARSGLHRRQVPVRLDEGRAHRVGDVRIGADLLFVVDDLAAPLGDVKEDANLFGVARPRPRPRGRSEERRVGTEWFSTCRSRWSPSHTKKKKSKQEKK